MAFDTYSFKDVNVVLAPPGYPAYTINGQGVGTISIAYTDDNTTHDRSADGRIMISKIESNAGSISFTIQQVSPLNTYLRKLFAYLKGSDSTLWAASLLTLNTVRGAYENIVCSGVSFTKRADLPFESQGQMITWNFMASDINQLT